MTLSEAGGRVAEAFRNSPNCLAAILLAALFAVLTYFAMQKAEDRRQVLFESLIGACGYLQIEENSR
jgi:hypothetical protein